MPSRTNSTFKVKSNLVHQRDATALDFESVFGQRKLGGGETCTAGVKQTI